MGTGGYRYGAGRPGWKVKAEHCKHIDVGEFHRKGLLNGVTGIWKWTNTESGEVIGSIGFRTDGNSIYLDYNVDDHPIKERIPLSSTTCHFGGVRPWFVCPRCCKRSAALYLRDSRYLCRGCQKIAYLSQSQDAIGRSWIRQAKAEARLGENWERPKGMHQRTHQRLLAIIHDYHEWREAEIEWGLIQAFRGRCTR